MADHVSRSRSMPRQDLHLITNAVEIREKATEVALSLVAGAYQTSLVSYLTHRDLFPALMKVKDFN